MKQAEYYKSQAIIDLCKRNGFAKRIVRDLAWFMTKVNKTDTCWEWTGALNGLGQGVFSNTRWQDKIVIAREQWKAHRYSWLLHFGEDPKENLIRQTCENKKCVRPDHLKIHRCFEARDKEWFLVKVNKYGPVPKHRYELGPCWLWMGNHDEDGYGFFQYLTKQSDGTEVLKSWKAHRFSWVTHYGEIPDNLLVCHHCDTPGCVRPEHLFIGTHGDNVHDMLDKGRGQWQLNRPSAQIKL